MKRLDPCSHADCGMFLQLDPFIVMLCGAGGLRAYSTLSASASHHRTTLLVVIACNAVFRDKHMDKNSHQVAPRDCQQWVRQLWATPQRPVNLQIHTHEKYRAKTSTWQPEYEGVSCTHWPCHMVDADGGFKPLQPLGCLATLLLKRVGFFCKCQKQRAPNPPLPLP
ncbi:hypothetical protein HaLaN_25834 [Haematococcus lacustris]|uniref:Uncharacterized protein n=1 Tax=Haematococcus lacustris TaxID=44745 RepID=A0A6A0A4A9_HAELA|nr:hypothetical protein HaLaN_25834 [Haematococcus lacustris]